MHGILEAFQDRNVELIFDGMKSRRISGQEPQAWTCFVFRDIPQTTPISFHDKEITPAGLLQFYLPP